MPYLPKVPSLYSSELGHLNRLVKVASMDKRLSQSERERVIQLTSELSIMLQRAQSKPVPKQ